VWQWWRRCEHIKEWKMKMNRASHRVINSRGWPRRRPRDARFLRRPVMATRRSASAGTKRLILSPGACYQPGLKGVPGGAATAKPFSPSLGYKPGQMCPNEPGPRGAVRLGGFGATWPGLWSGPRTRPGPKGPDERPVFY
jgi:hypothetical protein